MKINKTQKSMLRLLFKIHTTLFLVLVLTLLALAACAPTSSSEGADTNEPGGDNGDGGDGGDTGGNDGGDTGGDDGDGGDTGTDPITFADVSKENCGNADAALNCFISTWNTSNNYSEGAHYVYSDLSGHNQLKLPLVENGKYDFYVDWGDGTEVVHITNTTATHTYTNADENTNPGEKTIYIAGEIEGWRFSDFSGQRQDAIKLLDVKQWGSLSFGDTAGYQFAFASNFNPTAADAPDLSKTKNLDNMFSAASKFNGAIGNWDVQNITSMEGMFENADTFNQPLSNWGEKMQNVTNLSLMFSHTGAFDQDINNWNVSSVANMFGMFNASKKFNKPLDQWKDKLAKVTSMKNMFNGTIAFDQDVNNWNVSSVTNMGSMFSRTIKFNQPLDQWKDKLAKVTSMNGMFSEAQAFDQDIGGWDVSSVVDMGYMFFKAAAFNQNISGWNVDKVDDNSFANFSVGSPIANTDNVPSKFRNGN